MLFRLPCTLSAIPVPPRDQVPLGLWIVVQDLILLLFLVPTFQARHGNRVASLIVVPLQHVRGNPRVDPPITRHVQLAISSGRIHFDDLKWSEPDRLQLPCSSGCRGTSFESDKVFDLVLYRWVSACGGTLPLSEASDPQGVVLHLVIDYHGIEVVINSR